MSLALVGLGLFVYYRGSNSNKNIGRPPSSEQLLVNANTVWSGFDQVCSELHLPAMTPIVKPVKVSLDADDYGTGPGPTIKLTDSLSYQFTFLQADGSVISYFDNRLFDNLYNFDSPYYDKPDKPKWTNDQAIQTGSSFLKILAPQLKIKLGDGFARFDQKFQNSRYHAGEWMIEWPRVDDKGHFFSEDRVIMEIPENHSPISVLIKQLTSYVQEKGDPITKEQAFKKLQSKIAEEDIWDEFVSFIPGHFSDGWVEAKVTAGYLQIVCPRHQTSAPARLAWVFWCYQHPKGMLESPPHPPVHFHYPVSYWIDAYTGEYIGGDVVGLDTPD